jgi:hypothetical protein
MVRSHRPAILILSLHLVGCSSNATPRGDSLKFVGSWTETFTDSGAQITKEVLADGPRFKIVAASDPESGREIRVYDGHRYFEKIEGGSSHDQGNAISANEKSVSYMRFWLWTPEGTPKTGEPIVRRESILYEAREPISKTIFRRWVDAQTGVLLKEEQRRAEDDSVKYVRMCQKITFGDIDTTAFDIQ